MGTDRAGFAWKNLEPTFAGKTPIEVTQTLVDGYIRERRKVARPSTIRFEIACLYASWNWAAHKRRRLILPTDLPDLEPPPPGSPRRERWLDNAELEALFAAAAGDPAEIFLWLALDTAGRREALCELRWEQVDFEADVVHLNPPGRLQTRKKRASVPLSPRLREVLLHARKPSGLVCELSPSRAYYAVRRVAARAGLAGVAPHVLRHTAATHMARRGVSLWIIAQVLGNSYDEVEKTYAKWSPGFARDAVGLIGGPAIRPRAVES
jgi:integrase